MADPVSTFTYTDSDGDKIRIARDHAVIRVSTVDRDGGATIVHIPHHVVPTLAKGALAAAGDTGHEVVSASGLDSQLPDRGGDIITDLDVALATRTDLTDEHRACYEAILSRVEEIRAERDQALRAARSMRERLLAEVVDLLETHGTTDALLNDVERLRALPLIPDGDTTDAEARDAAYDQGHADGLRMGEARAEETEARLAALEKLTSDQADEIEAQSRLIDALRADMRSVQAAIRGLGEALQGRIQVQVDPLKGRSADEWFEFGKRLRRDMGENE